VEADPSLRRIERTAVVVCLAMVVLALVLARGRLGPAAGVLGGGLLMAISYRTIASNVTGFVNLLAPPAGPAGASSKDEDVRPPLAFMAAKLVARYALLALLAYVMIARLRLHPLGLLAGASSIPVAVSFEAIRLHLKK